MGSFYLMFLMLFSSLSLAICDTTADISNIIRAQTYDTAAPIVFPGERPAGLKDAIISSTYKIFPHPAEYAIDGLDSTYTHTDYGYEQWLQVSLLYPTVISRIVITNRVDCCQSRINPSFLFIKATPFNGTTINQLLQERGVMRALIDTTAAAYTLNFPSYDVQTTYVRIVNGGANYLNLAEISVYTHASTAVLERAVMSSVYTPAPNPASHAIDGDVRTFCHTASGDSQWLKIDLLQSVNVSLVQIINRLDCCQERIQRAFLFLKNSPFNGTTINQLLREPGVSKTWLQNVQTVYNSYFDKVPTRFLWILQSTSEPVNLAEVYVYY